MYVVKLNQIPSFSEPSICKIGVDETIVVSIMHLTSGEPLIFLHLINRRGEHVFTKFVTKPHHYPNFLPPFRYFKVTPLKLLNKRPLVVYAFK